MELSWIRRADGRWCSLEHLDLSRPIYAPSAAYGHFGRQAEGDFFPWEKTDLADALKAAL